MESTTSSSDDSSSADEPQVQLEQQTNGGEQRARREEDPTDVDGRKRRGSADGRASRSPSSARKEKKVRILEEQPVQLTSDFLEQHVGELDDAVLERLKVWVPPPKGRKALEVEEEQRKNKELAETYIRGDFEAAEDKEAEEASKSKFGIRISFGFNVILLLIKTAILALSGSISIFASLLDSILDMVSGSIIILANWLQQIRTKDYYKYPVGKRRLETIAVLVFSAAMFTATGELLVHSIQSIINPETISLSFDYLSIALVAVVIVIKFGLWVICRRGDSVTLKALAQDHLNDIWTNIVGIFCGVVGYYFWPLLDPIGGLVLGVFIMINWARTGIENARLMTGRSADPQFISLVARLAAFHHPKVRAVDTVLAYYVSNRLVVEIDLILPPEMSLRTCISSIRNNTLQNRLMLVDLQFYHLKKQYNLNERGGP